MKTIFSAIFFLAAASTVACGGAPIESGEPAAKENTAATPNTAAEETKTETGNVHSDTVYGTCTPAELRHCINTDPGGFGSGCELVNGKPLCLYY